MRRVWRLGQVQEDLPVALPFFFLRQAIIRIICRPGLLQLDVCLAVRVAFGLLGLRWDGADDRVDEVCDEEYPESDISTSAQSNLTRMDLHHHDCDRKGGASLHAVPVVLWRREAAAFTQIPRQSRRWLFWIAHIGSRLVPHADRVQCYEKRVRNDTE